MKQRLECKKCGMHFKMLTSKFTCFFCDPKLWEKEFIYKKEKKQKIKFS